LIKDGPLEISEVFQAYYDCRRTKRNSESARSYEISFERNLIDLYERLIDKTYEPSKSSFFVVLEPKVREIWAADFEDRIVHHILYNRFYDRFVNSFIYDSYACIPNKGTLKASERLQKFVRSATENHTKQCHYLKCDIANFFMAINKDILYQIICRKVHDVWWKWLTHAIIYHDPTQNFICKSSKPNIDLVPKNKSLFRTSANIGLPIGNLSSQFFGNIYLNELDQYIKHHLRVKYYIRYADDIVMLNQDPKILNQSYQLMCDFVQHKLLIRFHPNKKQTNLVKKGVDFVGYIIKEQSKYLRRRTISNLYKKVHKNKNKNLLIPSINSYFGMMRHADCFNERKRFVATFKARKFKFDNHLTKVMKNTNK
jgi:RNA-directed DNA polymerase